ncbi:MAG TPA: HAMP domain-containing sensor histidine kinase [Bryobacteraceae bacterium]|nr:HAMP domain-containing sensor histidine kinase [Bryobacteraceae bacterium]
MQILLVSTDKQLYKLCRETLASFRGEEWTLNVGAAPESGTPSLDLCIWDCDSDVTLPRELDLEQERKNIFLVSRKKMAALRNRLPMAAMAILLKPVNRATLRTFLEQAVARHKMDQASSVESLRADRDEILQCLLQANLKLQEYDQDRTNFLARAVHDFRAPLTAIDGYCGLILGQQLGPITEEQQEVLERMQHSIKRLSRMATAMFQLSVGRQIDKRPNLEKGDMNACIDQAMHEIAPFSDAKHIQVNLHMMASPQALYFDRAQIEQVLINLLDNACKFTPKYGAIELRGYPYFWERRAKLKTAIANGERRISRLQAPNSFRIDIRDSGPGVPFEHLEKIFEEYTSYTGGQDRSGGGLGLAICKFILNLHQGQVWAESGADGSTFSFVLPFVQQDAQPVVISDPHRQMMQAGA